MLPPERRVGRVLELIEEHKFFTLHAGRQMGKTTSLMWLQEHLSGTGSWRALWVDIETAREQPDPMAAISVLPENIEHAHTYRYPDLDGSAEVERTSSLRAAGWSLDLGKLLAAFQAFWRKGRPPGGRRVRVSRGGAAPDADGVPTAADRERPSWGEKLFVREVEHEGKRVRIVGC